MTATPSTLIFVDTTVDNYQSLLLDADPTAEIIILDPDQDGIQQISQVLATRSAVGSVQILSHGNSGRLKLGTADLNSETLDAYAEQIQQWQAALTSESDILLYGCNVAADAAGQAFVQRISQLTGADVAASTDLTGNAAQNGNWTLEFTTGLIESPIAFQIAALNAYSGLLRSYNVSTTAELRNAISESQTTVEDDVINLTSSINLTEELPAITSNIAFVGNSYTVSGGNIYRPFTVNSGTVSFSNVTIANGRAQGTAGAAGTTQPGGDGGVGRGGGLLINGGAVSLINTNFLDNQAIGGQGGDSLSGIGGNGGAGQGGAINVNAGSLRISTTSFNNNAAIAGAAGGGSGSGTAGSGKGGAIFVNTGATVIAERTPAFNGNTATTAGGIDTDNVNLFGSLSVVIPPMATAISLVQPETTASANVSYTVAFDQDVTGVDLSDFTLLATGITGAGILSVAPAPNSSRNYMVIVNTGSGNGTLRLDLVDNDSIGNAASVPLGSTGLGNGGLAGAAYTINKTPPAVFSIAPQNPSPTAAASLTYRVLFTQDVSGVDAADFALNSAAITGASVTSVTPVSGRAYDVTVNSGTGNGSLRLDLVDNDSIVNSLGVQLGGTGINNGSFTTGQAYSIDKTPPVIAAIAPADPNPTRAATVAYTVTFSQTVSGVDTTDFTLAQVGVTGGSIASVTPVSGTTYRVLVNTGTGDGSLGLNLSDNDSIQNNLGVALGGVGLNNGDFTGQTYTLLKGNPAATSIALVNPNPTAANIVNFAVAFSQDVTGVDVSDFALSAASLTGAAIASVTPVSGNIYNVAVNTGSNSGTLGLNLIDDDSILNAVSTPLGGAGVGNGGLVGQAYTVNKVPPRVASISRLDANPTNGATINFAVVFNESVAQVDANDFALATQGVTNAQIASVTRVNGNFYTVAVATGSGNGSIGLSLVDNDSILNSVGTPLGGVGANNGSFSGEIYSIDKAAPTVDIVDVAPDPRRDLVDQITLRFSEAVTGFNLADLQLTRGGAAVSLKDATLVSADGINWILGNLRKQTNQRGDYALTLAAGDSGIRDAAGNALAGNAIDRWTNLLTVNACLPGVTLTGTRGNDRLTGSNDNDVLQGLEGDDTLIGLDCQDRLVGDRGNDRLLGGEGNDTLLGGAGNDSLEGGLGADLLEGGLGADRFVYSGSSQAEALAQSLADAPDRIRGFRFSQGDRIQLDFDGNLNRSDRPTGLFHAGRVNGRNLAAAAQAAYRDKNRSSAGAQALRSNEAVFFEWRNQTYLSVNDGSQVFSAARDSVANVNGISYRAGDANAGVLTVTNYFI